MPLLTAAGYFLEISAEDAALQAIAGGLDVGVMQVLGASVMGLLQDMSGGPDKQASSANYLCNRARWMEHKAEQMFALANTLEKDGAALSEQTRLETDSIGNINKKLEEQRAQWKREFPVQLVVTVTACVGMVIVFICYAISKGRTVRSKLSVLRGLEARAQAAADAAASEGA